MTGCVAGILVALSLFVVSRPASGDNAVGAEVDFYANLTGDLGVSPAGPRTFIHARALRPGDPPATGSFELTNQTGGRLAIRLGAVPSVHLLDGLLNVRLRCGGQVLASGPLGALQSPGTAPLILDPGETKTITASASLSPGASDEQAAAALVDVAVVFPRDVIGAPKP